MNIRYIVEEPTPQQRRNARGSPLYQAGDMLLVWANQGDLAALTTQPDRYRNGFEKAREMAAEKVGWYCARSGNVCANAIRNMEIPDDR